MAGLGTFLLQVGVDTAALQRGLNNAESSLTSFGRRAESIGTKLSIAVSAPLALLAKKAITAFGEMEALELSLGTLEKTSTSLTARLKELNEVAKLPGIGFKEAIQADVRLRAVGISADISKRAMLSFGNAIATAGGGKAQFDSVIYQLAQMSAKSKVLSQDFRPIIEAVPMVASAVKKLYGTVDTEQIQSKMSKAGINSTQFINQLITELEKLPKVSGGVKNAIENLEDTFFKTFASIGGTIDKNVGIKDWVEKISNAATGLAESFANLTPEAQKAILAISGIAIVVPPLLALAGTVLPAIGAGFAALTGPVGLAALAIGAAATYAISHWEELNTSIDRTSDSLKRNFLTLRFYLAKMKGAISPDGNAKEMAEILGESVKYKNKGKGGSVVSTDDLGSYYDKKEGGIAFTKANPSLGGGVNSEALKAAKKLAEDTKKVREDLINDTYKSEIEAITDSFAKQRAEANKSYLDDIKAKKDAIQGKKGLDEEYITWFIARYEEMQVKMRAIQVSENKTPELIKRTLVTDTQKSLGSQLDNSGKVEGSKIALNQTFAQGLKSIDFKSESQALENYLGLAQGSINSVNFSGYAKQAQIILDSNQNIKDSYAQNVIGASQMMGNLIANMVTGTATMQDLAQGMLANLGNVFAQVLAEMSKMAIIQAGIGLATFNPALLFKGISLGIASGVVGGLSNSIGKGGNATNRQSQTNTQPSYSVVRGGDIYTAQNRYQTIKGF